MNILTEKIMATSFVEEVRVTGEELISTLREIVTEGNVRRVVVKNKKGKILLDLPLNYAGLAAGAGLALLSPWISAIALFVLFYNDFSIFVERSVPKEIEVVDVEDEDEDEYDDDDDDKKREQEEAEKEK
jgi:hypothetical protein